MPRQVSGKRWPRRDIIRIPQEPNPVHRAGSDSRFQDRAINLTALHTLDLPSMQESPASNPSPDYAALDTAQLVSKLAGEGDRAPQALIDACVSCGESMVETLRASIADHFDDNDHGPDAWWLPLHAAMILGRIPSESAGLLLAELMRTLDAQHEEDLQDWLAGYWPALFSNKPASVIDAVRLIAEDPAHDWYMRCQAVEVVLDAGLNQGGDTLEACIDWAAGMASDAAMEWVFRTWAACALLDFPRERHRVLLETIAREDKRRRIGEPFPQGVFTIDDIAHAFANPDPTPRWRRHQWRNPWRFYDPDAIAARQQRWREEEESGWEEVDDDWAAPPVTHVRATPKVGRNDPCPCGSGKKYKRCCLGK